MVARQKSLLYSQKYGRTNAECGAISGKVKATARAFVSRLQRSGFMAPFTQALRTWDKLCRADGAGLGAGSGAVCPS